MSTLNRIILLCAGISMCATVHGASPATAPAPRGSERQTNIGDPMHKWTDVVDHLAYQQVLKVFPGERQLLDRIASGGADDATAEAVLDLVDRAVKRRDAVRNGLAEERNDARFAYISAWLSAVGMAHLTSDEKARERILAYWDRGLVGNTYPKDLMWIVAAGGDRGFLTPSFMEYFKSVKDDDVFLAMCHVFRAHGGEAEMKMLWQRCRSETNRTRAADMSVAAAWIQYALAPEDQKQELLPVHMLRRIRLDE